MAKIDILFVCGNAAEKIYQELYKEHTAVETPIWAGLLANHCRSKGFSVEILDCEVNQLNDQEAVSIIQYVDPRVACFVVYGQQPSASSQNMEGAVSLAKKTKQISHDIKILFVGGHVAALPLETLEYDFVDFVCQNEGVYTISNLLTCDNLDDHNLLERVKGLGWKAPDLRLNPINPIVPQDRLEHDLPGVAWDLLPPPSKYRTAGWHSLPNGSDKSPFAALYTSLGCPFKCFPTGTKVITSDCPNKPIQKVNVGDKLIGYDVKTGKLAETEVMKVFSRQHSGHLLRIKFENGKTIKCTDEHPFYVHGEWIEAKDLKVNDEIHNMNFREKIAFNKHLYNPSFAQESRERMSFVMKDAIASGKMKNNFADKEWHKKYPSFSNNPEGKDELYRQHSERMKTNNPMFREDVREKVSNTQKEKIKTGEIVPFMTTEKYWDKIATSPNKMEQSFNSFLETHFPEEWKFVGDGSVRFDYYSPDFINVKGKNKIIELHGCYWHKCSACHPEFEGIKYNRDKDRVKTYEKHGFKTLEIWQHELKDEESLIKKIGEFLYNGLKIVEIKKYGLRKPITVHNFECYPYDNYFVGLSRASSEYVLSHNCSFCCINTINRTDQSPHITTEHNAIFRHWRPEFIIKEFEYLANNGVVNIKIADEMFILKDAHFMTLCKMIAERGMKPNIWCYGRCDVTKSRHLETLKNAGVNFIALGIESPNQTVRKDVIKGSYQEIKILDLLKQIKEAGINVMANYIFGLPEDTLETMQETLDFAMTANTESVNFYVTQAYPGSPLHLDAKQNGWKLPDRYAGYSQHSYWTQNLPSKHLSAAEIINFRDEAWMKYFTNPSFLSVIESKFGTTARQNIESSAKIKLKRKLLGDTL